MKKVLLTGGAGFIGHHTVEHILRNTDWEIVIMDRLTYAGNQNFLTSLSEWEQEKHRVKFIYHDFRSPVSPTTQHLIGNIDYLIHMGAETHVDRSITEPMPFATTNVIGTVNILELAKAMSPEKMIYVSTDEVYGPTIMGKLHKEGEPHKPSNPYSASKSGAEAFCYAYWNTYGVPVAITNTMNNFGERQNSEKFVPKTIKAILDNRPVVVHCKKDAEGNVSDVSSRCWLHARNHADALIFLLASTVPFAGEKFNVVGEYAAVDTIADMIATFMGKERADKQYEDFHSFRPGHDMHYGLDGTKLAELGWAPKLDLYHSMEKVVEWTLARPQWLE
jgi:dTDP-glucose 4,6-dehydratase